MSGSELFQKAVDFFGRSSIRGVRGAWTYGDNLATVNRLTAGGATLEEAAAQTFTGKMAGNLGFKNVEIVGTPKGSPGAYTNVQVIFR